MDNIRLTAIKKLYQKVLGREGDDGGIINYYNSGLSLGDIERIFYESDEHKKLITNDPGFNITLNDVEIVNLYTESKTKIDYYKNKNSTNNKIVVSIRGCAPTLNLEGAGFLGKKLLNLGYDVICFKTKSEFFYGDVSNDILDKITSILSTYETKYGIGVSMGGYNILSYSKLFELSKIYCLCPRKQYYDLPGEREWHQVVKNLDENSISPSCEYYVFVNSNHNYDVIDANYFLNKLPKEKTKLCNIPDSPEIHLITETFYKFGTYNEFINLLFVDEDITESKLNNLYKKLNNKV